jgi:hypothetical protein
MIIIKITLPRYGSAPTVGSHVAACITTFTCTSLLRARLRVMKRDLDAAGHRTSTNSGRPTTNNTSPSPSLHQHHHSTCIYPKLTDAELQDDSCYLHQNKHQAARARTVCNSGVLRKALLAGFVLPYFTLPKRLLLTSSPPCRHADT